MAFPPAFLRIVIAEALDNDGPPPGEGGLLCARAAVRGRAGGAGRRRGRARAPVPERPAGGAGTRGCTSPPAGPRAACCGGDGGGDGCTHAVVRSGVDPNGGYGDDAADAAEVAATDFEAWVTRQWIESRLWNEEDEEGPKEEAEEEAEAEGQEAAEQREGNEGAAHVEVEGVKGQAPEGEGKGNGDRAGQGNAEGTSKPLPPEARDYLWYNFTAAGQRAYPRPDRHGPT